MSIKGLIESAQLPWQRFRVGSPPSPWDRQLLTEVSHVAHLETAHRIIVEGKLRSGLVTDKSKLKKERILVAWLSPNNWEPGSRYGSIEFVFDWPTLYKGHRAYWVESIPYRPEACRILLTKEDHSDRPDLLIPYDPTVGDGPWWLDQTSGIHYWNGNYCLEFMIEHDIETSDILKINYIKHHRRKCSVDPKKCPERGLSDSSAQGQFLARLVASGSKLPTSIKPTTYNSWNVYARTAQYQIFRETKLSDFLGDLTSEAPGSSEIARAFLNAYVNPMLREDIPYLASLFRSRAALEDCCQSLIRAVMPK